MVQHPPGEALPSLVTEFGQLQVDGLVAAKQACQFAQMIFQRVAGPRRRAEPNECRRWLRKPDQGYNTAWIGAGPSHAHYMYAALR